MIRVELGREIRKHGRFEYRIFSGAGKEIFCGISRQPLLDACREIKRMGNCTSPDVGLFRNGRSTPDLACSIEWGADHTARETKTEGLRFVKFQEFPEDFPEE